MPLDRTIAALGDPTRREILRRLADAPRRAGELAAGFAISRPAVCKHTRLLTRAGLIRARKSGRERIYELAPSGGKAMREAIEQTARDGTLLGCRPRRLQTIRGEAQQRITGNLWARHEVGAQRRAAGAPRRSAAESRGILK